MQKVMERKLTIQDKPPSQRTVFSRIRAIGNSIVVKAGLNGTTGAMLQVNLYPQGTLPRQFGRIIPKIPDAEPIWNAKIILTPARPFFLQSYRIPNGKYDVLVLADGQPVGAMEITSDPFGGPLLEAIILLGLAVALYYSMRR